MDYLRRQWTLIQDRLAGLNASQKMLVAALVVITIMTMLYWGRYASGREMVALTSVPMSAEDIQAATQSLQAKGIKFTTSGNTIMVPTDEQMSAYSSITFSGAITSPNFFESMFEKVSAFGTAGDYKARLNNARERTLSAMLTGWPDVKSASVLVNDPQQSGIGRFEPRATINITTKDQSGTRKLGQAARMLVLNAVSGLKGENITVLVDGISIISASDSIGGGGNDALDIIRTYETDMIAKIRGQYSFIPAINVSVTADVNTETKREVIHKVDPTNKVLLPTKSTNETTTSNEPAASGEPGLMANASVDANATAVAATIGSSTERTDETNHVDYGKSETEITSGPGKPHALGAAVRVPRSYFIGVWRVKTGKRDGEPTEAEYTAIADKELASMRGEVQKLTAIADESKISVAEFPDLDGLASLMNPGKVESSSAGLSHIAVNYAREGAIGVLALASLFMVSRIVKKSVPAPALALAGIGMGIDDEGTSAGGAGKGKSKGATALAGDEFIAGEVAEGSSVLMGRELDPATLETAQMVEQVSNYVKENPDTAANLIRRLMTH